MFLHTSPYFFITNGEKPFTDGGNGEGLYGWRMAQTGHFVLLLEKVDKSLDRSTAVA